MASSIGLRIGSAYRRAFYETGPAVTRANETTRPCGELPSLLCQWLQRFSYGRRLGSPWAICLDLETR